MKPTMRSRQRGITFFGLLFNAAVLAVLGLVGVQAVPTYIEYIAIGKAVDKARTGQTPDEIRSIFDKVASVDDIKSIAGKNLEIFKESEKVVVAFEYQREIHLAGPAYLTLKYAGRSK